MPRYDQNGGRWRGPRGFWEPERGRGQWYGPREESFWHTPGTEWATASTGDEEWRASYRGGPGGYGGWDGGPGFEGDFGRGRMGGYGDRGPMPGGYRGDYERGVSSGYDRDWSRSFGGYGRAYGRGQFGGYPQDVDYGGDWQRGSFGDYGEGRWRPGPTEEFGSGPMRGGYGRFDEYGRFGGRAWRGEGQFAGRGPRGYQRSDDRIREDVCEVLTAHWDVDASEIDVQVQNGEVMLSGNVTSRDQKRMAEDAIESVPGIRDVNNQLRVAQTQHGSMGGTLDTADMTEIGASRHRAEAGPRRETAGAGTSANSKPR